MMQIKIDINGREIICAQTVRVHSLDNEGTKKEYSYRIDYVGDSPDDRRTCFVTHNRDDGALVLASKVLEELQRIGESNEPAV